MNTGKATKKKNISPVLIDTWWNVNVSAEETTTEEGTGFNRYMVECELCEIWNRS